MRNLPSITVGNHTIEAYAEHIGGGVIEVSVHCGDKVLARRLSHQGKYDHTAAQFEKDINAFAQRLAEELAGSLRSEELARNFAQGSE